MHAGPRGAPASQHEASALNPCVSGLPVAGPVLFPSYPFEYVIARTCGVTEMLPGACRMRRGEDFTAAVRRGRRAGRPLLVVHLLSTAETAAVPRVGFVAARSVGNSVVRKRVLRRLRHLMRERIDELPAGSLVVIRANPAAARASSAQLRTDLDAALEKLERLARRRTGAAR